MVIQRDENGSKHVLIVGHKLEIVLAIGGQGIDDCWRSFTIDDDWGNGIDLQPLLEEMARGYWAQYRHCAKVVGY